MALVTPTRAHLPDYCAALARGWSPNNLRAEAAQEELQTIAEDADAFLASLGDPDARRGDVKLPDGTFTKRLPSLRLWMWDNGVQGGFCGSIGLRWQPGTNDLPKTASGHVGYAVVPWRRRQGHASAALCAILPIARKVGLDWIELTTDPGNVASIGVIEKAGGYFISRSPRPPQHGTGDDLRYRIDLKVSG